MNWIYDPALPAPRRATVHSSNTPVHSRDTPVLTSDTQASAIATRTSSHLASPQKMQTKEAEKGSPLSQ